MWDTIFYMRIAKCGYEFEQYHAFFPLLPALIRAMKYLGERLYHLPLKLLQLCALWLSPHSAIHPIRRCVLVFYDCARVASWLSPVRLCSDTDALLVISGLLVSNAAFIISALYLDRYISFAICLYRKPQCIRTMTCSSKTASK